MAVKFILASKNLPLIMVRVDMSSRTKKKTITALLDTGATGNVISKDLAKEMNFEKMSVPSSEMSAHGIGGEVQIQVVKAKEIHLDGCHLKNARLAVMDLSMVQKQFESAGVSSRINVEMILGYPFFKGKKLMIDYKGKKLSIK
jgi:predicted aspartyl protease